MQLAIIGTGYVGLVTGTCFAETGNNVICIDINEEKINQLKTGKSPIYEPGLDVLLERNIKENRLTFTTSVEEGIEKADVIFLALPTPPGKDGAADLQFVLDVAAQLSTLITSYKVIVNKSTVPVGTAEKVTDELYQPFVRQGNPVYYMDERSAEMTKYAGNAYLAMRISFMNEMANLCEKAGANVDLVRIGIGSDNRIGKRFLFPGVGYGGSCFPKDVQALGQIAREYDYEFNLVNTVIKVNNNQKLRLGKKIKDFFGNNLSGKTFAVWGLAFKPETDDIREAPALELIDELVNAGATVKVYDPEAMENVRRILGEKISYAANQYDAITGADALVIVTEWSEFRNPDFARISETLKMPVIFDGRNVYTLEKMEECGFYYESIGRKVVNDKIRASIAQPVETAVRERKVID